jgi:hypothetical protein
MTEYELRSDNDELIQDGITDKQTALDEAVSHSVEQHMRVEVYDTEADRTEPVGAFDPV